MENDKDREDAGLTTGGFSYEISQTGILITGCDRIEDTVIDIPKLIEGRQVTAIGAYAFKEFRKVRFLSIPDTVTSLGNHCFYNCRKLEQITLSDAVMEVEDGAFKNCEELTAVTMKRITGKSTCLKCIMNEINAELEFTLQYGTDTVKLIFPRYVYDYEANVEARIINQITYGTGVHYRECVRGGDDIDYQAYDQVFKMAVYNDEGKTLRQIAGNRLLYPWKLSKEAKSTYMAYMKEHLCEEIEELAGAEDTDTIKALGELGLYTAGNVEELLETAHKAGNIPCVTCLMEYKRKLMGRGLKERFSL